MYEAKRGGGASVVVWKVESVPPRSLPSEPPEPELDTGDLPSIYLEVNTEGEMSAVPDGQFLEYEGRARRREEPVAEHTDESEFDDIEPSTFETPPEVENITRLEDD